MHTWYKTVIYDTSVLRPARKDHFWEADELQRWRDFPKTPDDFFRQYVSDFHGGRVKELFDYIRPRVSSSEKIISIGSGNFGLELALQEEVGCEILCTDIDAPPWLEPTRTLFGDKLRFEKLNILTDKGRMSWDDILCFGVAYVFDEKDLAKAFEFAWNALVPGGRLFIDSAGPPDNIVTRVFHDVWLPLEAPFEALAKTIVRRKRHGIRRVHHGYHHASKTFLSHAAAAGFVCEEIHTDAYTRDFLRSRIVKTLIQRSAVAHTMVTMIGKRSPYCRVFCFRKPL